MNEKGLWEKLTRLRNVQYRIGEISWEDLTGLLFNITDSLLYLRSERDEARKWAKYYKRKFDQLRAREREWSTIMSKQDGEIIGLREALSIEKLENEEGAKRFWRFYVRVYDHFSQGKLREIYEQLAKEEDIR